MGRYVGAVVLQFYCVHEGGGDALNGVLFLFCYINNFRFEVLDILCQEL